MCIRDSLPRAPRSARRGRAGSRQPQGVAGRRSGGGPAAAPRRSSSSIARCRCLSMGWRRRR
eukprot:10708738-Alexandrium_andersonii.AAC.1